MKKVNLRSMITLALFVATLVSANNLMAQSVNMSRYITLTVSSGQEIKINLWALEDNTPVRIVSGNKSYDIIVNSKWTGTKKYLSDGTTMTLYGDIMAINCNANEANITAIDVSNNTVLTDFYCNDNQLTSIDVSKNTALRFFLCSRNQLTSIDVSKNTELRFFVCNENQLTSLDVSKNTVLGFLYCRNNQLTSLDVSKNMELTNLNCSYNKLTSLYIKHNMKLEELLCYNNSLSTASIDSIYCALPNRNGKKEGLLYPVYNSSSADHAVVLATTAGNATDKNWKVRYLDSDDDITTTGSYVCSNTSVVDVNAAVALDLYPNPVENLLYIEAEGEVYSIRVYNVYGTEVANTVATKQIDLSNLSAGVYAVRVETDKGISVRQIVKR